MSYKLIRIDPIHRIFELKFINDVSTNDDVETTKKSQIEKPIYIQDSRILVTKLPIITGDAILIDNDEQKPGEKDFVITCQEESSRFTKKAIVNYRRFTGSYKPFWVETVNDDGIKVIETNLIPDTKKLKRFREDYIDFVKCLNDKEHMEWFIRKQVRLGIFGGFEFRSDGCIYNEDNKLIYEFSSSE